MDARLIAVAIPIFFLLIGVELLIFRRREKGYRLHDSINSLSCGVGQQVIGIAFGVAKVGVYALVYEHARIATISPRSALAWVALLFGVDLGYWVYHFTSHRVNFFWATHAVHHQSEEYNLSTALRQSWFTQTTSWIFYLPLAVIGFPPSMFVVMYTVNTLYQFWIHTRVVGRIGLFEAFLNTPSHHRVHHGIDPIYIDKNYAGIFILWDRLFGTYQREEREPVYGTVKPLASWNPLWANVEPWVKIGEMARQTRRLRDKLLVWIMPPEWRPLDLGGKVVIPEVDRAAFHKYHTRAPRGLNRYVMVNFALVAAATSALLSYVDALSSAQTAAIVAAMLLTLVAWGGLFEAKPWAVSLEWARLALVVAIGAWLAAGTAVWLPISAASLALGIALGLWAARYRGRRLEPQDHFAGDAASPSPAA